MPTPLDLLMDPVAQAMLAIYAALMLWEHLAPARALPASPWWRLRGIASFALYFLLSSYLPLLWADTLAAFQLVDLSDLPTLAGAGIGLLVYEAGAYAWHRSLHGNGLLWRWLHQLHHSAERHDSFGAFWFSPLDMVGWTALSSLALTLVVGLSAAATTAVLLTVTLLAIFQHTNVRTPRWLGYLVQRPESHSYHHERGQHRRNYADLPLFDILFGTFHNPHRFALHTGFHEGASLRVGEMLLGRDVTQPRVAADGGAAAGTIGG